MSIIISDIAYRHPDRTTLFENVSLAVGSGEKHSVVGVNGVGKSTLLRIIAGELSPVAGSVCCGSKPYYVPQNVGASGKTIAGTLGISEKLAAIGCITNGSVDPAHFDILADDWEIESRARQALDSWGLGAMEFSAPADLLSGGERTRLLLAGIDIHSPEIVLLDEPTNHLDSAGRERLYELVAGGKFTLVVVSHDVTLLNMLSHTSELFRDGIKSYGGGYDFYRDCKEVEAEALSRSIQAGERALRTARQRARTAVERQQRRENSAGKALAGGGQPRIIAHAKAGKGEATRAKLMQTHERRIEQSREHLDELRGRQESAATLRLDFDDARLHSGKLLFDGEGMNHEYRSGKLLWPSPVDFSLRSGQRVRLTGGNGSGKTTLMKIITGELKPTCGTLRRAGFSHVYLDQTCSVMESGLTVLEMAGSYNHEKLGNHQIGARLDRALFPRESWDKSCRSLSGGERMRLLLCCLMISNHAPDAFILDEPTNNLDLSSLGILIDTLQNYRGTLLVVSHDNYFVERIGVDSTILLSL